MPEIEFEAPDDTVLFDDDDPLTITLPGIGSWRCLDRANPPLEADVNPETKPVSYLVELLRLQVIEDQRDEFAEAITAAVADNRVMVRELSRVARWIGEQRTDAEKRATSKVAARPTRARRRSTSS